MARTTKTPAKKAAEKTTKTTAAKETSPIIDVKTDSVKIEAAAPVVEEKKTIKTEAKKASAKTTKTVKAEVKEEAKEEVKAEVIVEFSGIQVAIDEVVENVKKTFAADGGDEEIKSVKVYLKPEDQAAYYVINDKIEGKMDVYFCN